MSRKTRDIFYQIPQRKEGDNTFIQDRRGYFVNSDKILYIFHEMDAEGIKYKLNEGGMIYWILDVNETNLRRLAFNDRIRILNEAIEFILNFEGKCLTQKLLIKWIDNKIKELLERDE